MSEIHPADGTSALPMGWGTTKLYVAYHDHEWGLPVYDDRALFEMLVLDGFQAGLSWIIILRKRENFRRAFRRLRTGEDRALHAEKSRTPASGRRHRAQPPEDRKDRSSRARAWLDVMQKGPGFSKLLWDFVDGRPKINHPRSIKQVPAETGAVARDLEGARRPRLQVLRTDHRLRVHAGRRAWSTTTW